MRSSEPAHLSNGKVKADHLDQRQKPTSQRLKKPNKSMKSFELIWLNSISTKQQ